VGGYRIVFLFETGLARIEKVSPWLLKERAFRIRQFPLLFLVKGRWGTNCSSSHRSFGHSSDVEFTPSDGKKAIEMAFSTEA
jgi:hypothetical protein